MLKPDSTYRHSFRYSIMGNTVELRSLTVGRRLSDLQARVRFQSENVLINRTVAELWLPTSGAIRLGSKIHAENLVDYVKSQRKDQAKITSTTLRTTTKVPTTTNGRDDNSRCLRWATWKRCQKNRFIAKICRRSCGMCGSTKSVATETTTRKATRKTTKITSTKATTLNPEDCIDRHKKCKKWATANRCDTNRHVAILCKKSCGTCGSTVQTKSTRTTPSKPNCKDSSKHCSKWKKIGLCSESKTVRKLCKHSCNNCGTTKAEQTTETIPVTTTKTTNEETTTVTKHSCIDKHKKCNKWKNNGLCKTNRRVRRLCGRSCNTCGTTTNEQTTESTPETTTASEETTTVTQHSCIDKHKKCIKWKNNGLCKYNRRVRRLCGRSCNTCGTTTNEQTTESTPETTTASEETTTVTQHSCIDKHKKCNKWKNNGLCKTNRRVRRLCGRSCNTCGTTTNEQTTESTPETTTASEETTTVTQHSCIDKHKKCNKWKNNGLCKTNRRVRRLCGRSCNTCGTTTNEQTTESTPETTTASEETTTVTQHSCIDKHKKCNKWKNNGLCKTNRRVRRLCGRSCNTCGTTTNEQTTESTPETTTASEETTTVTQHSCIDKHKKCNKWKNNGLCKTNRRVRRLCGRSCNTCGTTTNEQTTESTPETTTASEETTTVTQHSCIDKHKKCNKWKKQWSLQNESTSEKIMWPIMQHLWNDNKRTNN
ncbi:hypothetical protein GQR58_027851 [Nymphon striatum]|nr:hypothetical protein GQR58_027851 [Nymphon striatum]